MKLTIAGLLAVSLPIISSPVREVAAADSAKNADDQTLLDVEYQWANAYVSRDVETVMVVPDGFAWNGEIYASLSAVAQSITGTKWNGHRFFGVRTRDRSLRKVKGTDEASGKTIEGQMRMTDTFIRQGGRWQVVASQTTLAPEPQHAAH